MSAMYQQFEKSIRWGVLESGLYQLLLFSHQIALFAYITPELYGVAGTLFSLLYLSIALSDGGLESTLPVFFPSAITSQFHAKHLLGKQFLPEMIVLIALGCFSLWYGAMLNFTDLPTRILISLLPFLEGTRKTIRKLLHLLFFNRELAFIELGSLALYLVYIWTYIIAGIPITVWHIIFPMFIASLSSLLPASILLYRWYRSLDATSQVAHTFDVRHIISQRFFNYITHVSHLLFSSNFLIPFFALQFGAASAGGFKLMSTLISSITIAFKKILGGSAMALLANMHHHNPETKYAAFSLIIKKTLYGITWSFTLFIAIAYILTHTHSAAFALFNYQIIVAYVFLTFSEYFLLCYEIFFITQQKSAHLTILSMCSLALVGCGLYVAQGASPFFLVVTLCIVRALSFIMTITTWLYVSRTRCVSPSVSEIPPTAI
jgi:hypothetical protein